MASPDLRDVGSRREGLGHDRRLLPGRSGPPTLAPGDQLETPIARASVPVVMPGISHDDARLPLVSTEEYAVLQPRFGMWVSRNAIFDCSRHRIGRNGGEDENDFGRSTCLLGGHVDRPL